MPEKEALFVRDRENNELDIRNCDEKNFHICNVSIFAGLLLIIGIILFIVPRSDSSETERRNLEKFPLFTSEALLSGEYTRKINTYFSDTVPFRDNLTAISSNLKSIMGLKFDSVRLHNVVIGNENNRSNSNNPKTLIIPEIPKTIEESVINNVNEELPLDTDNIDSNILKNINVSEDSNKDNEFIPNNFSSNDSKNNDSYVEEEESEIADIGNNGILVYKNRGLMLYGGNRSQSERYAAALNAYKDNLEGITIYNMLVPTSVEFYCPENYRSLSGNQREDINHITYLLDSNIKPVNVYSALYEHVNEDIYLRTDHHWAPLGAYYAAVEFCKKAGVDFLDLSKYKKNIISGYVGTLYGYSGDAELKNNPEDFVYFTPENSYSTTYYNYDDPESAIESSLFIKQSISMSYCIFMGGDSKITHIKTDVKNGRKLAVFKDSYGNALVPFLVNSFEEIYVLDIRYFPYNAIDYLNKNGISDLLFCNNIFAANTGSLIACIENIMAQ